MGLGKKRIMFISEYLQSWNATQAAIKAGYSEKTAYSIGHDLLKFPEVAKEIERRIEEKAMSANEVLTAVSDIARGSIEDLMDVDENGRMSFNFKRAKEEGKLHLIKSIIPTAYGLKVELHDRMDALQLIGKHTALFSDESKIQAEIERGEFIFQLPANAIAPSFYDAYRDISAHNHTEYVFKGGRGSTKSSFVSEVIIEQLINNPDWHALVTRQVKDTLRDSVFSQLVWAINYLGLAERFRVTTNPLEISYIATGQKIYFRGGDDPLKIKSIKPRFGYINILWFEELDQFRGSEVVRSIVQSAIRGGEMAYIFKSFNPPRSRNCWTFKELTIPKDNRFIHESDYKSVPVEWLGRTFIDEAEHLKEVNVDAYEHEYLGVANSSGGAVFENVRIRKIDDTEILEFDRVLHGLDFGYYPDPAHYIRCHFDAARLRLYVFGEYRGYKHSNRRLFDALTGLGVTEGATVIADSAEPKSVADLREYGLSCRAAEKGPESVKYSMKWLQSLREIVIDPERCPEACDEFINYEYEQDKDGNFISEFPDKNNHAIDAVRYATNLIWRQRGK